MSGPSRYLANNEAIQAHVKAILELSGADNAAIVLEICGGIQVCGALEMKHQHRASDYFSELFVLGIGCLIMDEVEGEKPEVNILKKGH